MTNFVAKFPVTIDVQVRWGDMDAFQHVNNTLYFRYFESVRIAYFEQLDVVEFLSGAEIGPILASINCRFRFPVTYPDTLTIGARITQMGTDRFLMEHRAVSQRHDAVVADGEGILVSYDYGTAKKAPIPELVRARVMTLEARTDNTIIEMVR